VAEALGQRAPLGALLAGTVEGVVEAQRVLDMDARARLTEIVETPEGEIVLPPLWYTVADARIVAEMAVRAVRVGPAQRGRVRLDARLLDPVSASLFGQEASTGVRVSMQIAPREAATAVPPPAPDTPPAEDGA
jgi:hypothetical protein